MTSTANARACETPAARQKRVWDKAAPSYDKQIAFFEKIQFGGGREWLGERAHGRVLEVAIGTGRNLPHYPPDTTVAGIELSPAMLAIARQRAAGLGRDVDLQEGDAEHLPFGDASFDTVVCALSLCTIPSRALHPPPATPCARRRIPGRRNRTTEGRHSGAHPRGQARLTRDRRRRGGLSLAGVSAARARGWRRGGTGNGHPLAVSRYRQPGHGPGGEAAVEVAGVDQAQPPQGGHGQARLEPFLALCR